MADLVQPLDHLGVHVDAHVLGALHQQRIVDQVAQQILLLRRRTSR